MNKELCVTLNICINPFPEYLTLWNLPVVSVSKEWKNSSVIIWQKMENVDITYKTVLIDLKICE